MMLPRIYIDETKADLVLTANPGCLLQLRAGVARSGNRRRVLHVVELLDEAYQLRRIFGKSLGTARRNRSKRKAKRRPGAARA